jgi:predicted ATPase/DNA-binding CsgD family transcriptional regulator
MGGSSSVDAPVVGSLAVALAAGDDVVLLPSVAEAIGAAGDRARRTAVGIAVSEMGTRLGDDRVAAAVRAEAAALAAVGHPGQVLLTAAAAGLVSHAELPGRLRNLGVHRLACGSRRVVELRRGTVRHPPLRTPEGRASRGRRADNRFVGRDEDVARIAALVRSQPVVTVVGPGGAGKTRLVLELVAREEGLAEELVVVELDVLPSDAPASEVRSAIGAALGLVEAAAHDPVPSLAGRDALLVLDNCEHVLDAVRDVVRAVTSAAPAVRVLATSRQPLRAPAEAIHRLGPLAHAAELFVERVRSADPSFDPGEAELAAIDELCDRLDRLPLAVELAAARMATMSARELANRLEPDLLRARTGGGRARQDSLRASLEWSLDLLTPESRRALAALSVLHGSWSRLAAEAIVAPPATIGIDDVLEELVSRSLVVAERRGDTMRFRLLQTVREVLATELEVGGIADAVRARHADHLLTETERLSAEVWAADRSAFDAFDALVEPSMQANRDAALQWFRRSGSADGVLRIVSAVLPVLDLLWIGEADPLLTLARSCFEAASWTAQVTFLHEVVVHELHATSRPVAPSAAVPTGKAPAHVPAELSSRLALLRGVANGATSEVRHAVAEAARAGDARLLALHRHVARLFDIDDHGTDALGPVARAYLLVGYGVQTSTPGQVIEQARSLAEEPLERIPTVRNHLLLAEAGARLRLHDDLDAVRRLCGEAIQGFEATGDRGCVSLASSVLSAAAEVTGEADESIAAAERDAVAWQEGSPRRYHVVGQFVRFHALLANGRTDAAADVIRAMEAVEPSSELVHDRGIWAAARALLDLERDLAPAALEHAIVAADEALRRGTPLVALTVGVLGVAAVRAGRVDEGVRALSAATRLVNATTFQFERPHLRRLRDEAVAHARARLGDDAFDEAWAAGLACAPEAVLRLFTRGRGSRRRPSTGWASLTPTEEQVVALVGSGLANKEIAARLHMSVRTVTTHLGHVYAKVGLASRNELVSAVARRATT